MTNKYPQATPESKRLAQGKFGGCHPAQWCSVGEQFNTNPIIRVGERVPESITAATSVESGRRMAGGSPRKGSR
jgi:hypothetical protein